MIYVFSSVGGVVQHFSPRRMEGEGYFADTDLFRCVKVSRLDEIGWEKRSDYSFEEVLLVINETLFYFTDVSIIG